MTKTISPVEHDERESAAMREREDVRSKIEFVFDRMHRMIGDRSSWDRGRKVWATSAIGTLDKVRDLAEADDSFRPQHSTRPSGLVAEYDSLAKKLALLNSDIIAMDQTWREHGWTRWIECLNSDGHIHSWFGCPTLNRGLHPTAVNWRTDLSGATIEDAIKDLGPRLCSVCFPDAPVELCQKKSDIERAAREAAKAAKLEASYAKNLRPEEQFRDGDHDLVTTVAGAKKVLRDAIDAAHYYPRSYEKYRAHHDAAVARAKEVLLGRGVTQEEIDKIEANTRKRIARDDARYGN